MQSVFAMRLSDFERFRRERLPVLHKFAEILGADSPHEILVSPERFIPLIGELLENQIVSEENRGWLISRVGYFIGELLVSRHGGCWLVDEREGSETYARFIVGEFADPKVAGLTFDPMAIARDYVDTPPPGDFALLFENDGGTEAC